MVQEQEIIQRKLLWVDDDPEDRFVYEQFILEEVDGWKIEWAQTIKQAIEMLQNDFFDALILDQMLPLKSQLDPPEILGGCILLHWIRGSSINQFEEKLTEVFNGKNPNSRNMQVQTVILSAYHNSDALNQIRKASKQDRYIVYLSKPTDVERLRNFLMTIY